MRFSFFCAAFVLLLSIAAFGQAKPKSISEVSMKAPDFAVSAMNGKTYRLADFKGKVIVMNFWSTTCPICAGETEDLNRLVDAYKGKDVVFLGFAHNSKANVEKFLKHKPFKFEIFPAAMQALIVPYGKPQDNGFYDIPFPMHILVDKNGIIQVNQTGLKGLKAVQEKLKEIFKNEQTTAKAK